MAFTGKGVEAELAKIMLRYINEVKSDEKVMQHSGLILSPRGEELEVINNASSRDVIMMVTN
jgi:hypothetical protein